MMNSIEGTGKNQLETGQVSLGDGLVLSQSSLLTNPYPKPARVLEHCRERETSC